MISVIIPVYNVEKYLHVCLNSILKQSYSNFEVICIDDASTDNSLNILEYFSKKDSRINIIKNEHNIGLSRTRNRGLKIAKGKYIYFIDGDDWISPNTFKIVMEKMEKDKLDLIMFKNIVYYEDTKNFGMEKYYDMEFMNKFENKIFNHYDLDKTKLFKIPNSACNKCYLKSFLDENNIQFPEKNLIYEDNPFYYKVITHAQKISFLNEYLYNRRRRENSLITLNNEKMIDYIKISYLISEVFLEEISLYQRYKRELLSHLFLIMSKKYDQIDDEFKEKFLKETQNFIQRLIDYELYDDILESVDVKILDMFHFDKINRN